MNHTWHLCPCPPYDIEALESWLTDQSARGLHLSADGFFAGFGIFEKAEPHPWVYRLDAVPGGGGAFDTDHDRPDEEGLSLMEDSGWEFVVRRGDFYIYRTDRQGAELHSDPAVQAMALKEVEKRLRGALWSAVFWAVVYPVVRRFANGHGFLRPMIFMGTWFTLTGAGIALWLLTDAIVRVVHLCRLRRRLRLGERLDHGKNWQRGARRRHVLNIAQIVLIVAWGCVLLTKAGGAIMEEGRVKLADYAGDLPFATFSDLCPPGEYRAETSFESNYICEWSDVLSPENAEYQESARIVTESGVYYATLYVDYNRLRAPFLARQLGREYVWSDQRRNDDFAELALPDDLPVDWAAAYSDNIHLPTVVLVKGDVVLRAKLLQYSNSEKLVLEDWVRKLAEGM